MTIPLTFFFLKIKKIGEFHLKYHTQIVQSLLSVFWWVLYNHTNLKKKKSISPEGVLPPKGKVLPSHTQKLYIILLLLL